MKHLLFALLFLIISNTAFSGEGVNIGNGESVRDEGVNIGNGIPGVEIGNGFAQAESTPVNYFVCSDEDDVQIRKVMAFTKKSVAVAGGAKYNSISSARPVQTYISSALRRRSLIESLVAGIQEAFGPEAYVESLAQQQLLATIDSPYFLVSDLAGKVFASFAYNCVQQQ